MIRRFILFSLCLFIFCTPLVQAHTRFEFSALSKILALSKDIISGPMTLGVIYNPTDRESLADLEKVKFIVGSGFQGPKHEITIMPITQEAFKEKSNNADALLVTKGINTKTLEKIRTHTIEQRKLSFTSNIPYVRSGHIIIGIKIFKENVKITINRKIYREAGLLFDAAFRFIVKEV